MRATIFLAVFATVTGRQACEPADPSPAWDPCASLACGAPCRPCPPEESCETFAATACDGAGACVTEGTFSCDDPPPYLPCDGKACGDPCTVCAPWDADCVEPAVVMGCDPAGGCAIDGSFTCPPPPLDPCANKACGERCATCDPSAGLCAAVMEYCDAVGACGPAWPICPAPAGP